MRRRALLDWLKISFANSGSPLLAAGSKILLIIGYFYVIFDAERSDISNEKENFCRFADNGCADGF
jgi:hypothetical protein